MIAAARKEVHFNKKSKEEGKYDMKCSAFAAAGWLSESPAALVSGAQSAITISTNMEPYFNCKYRYYIFMCVSYPSETAGYIWELLVDPGIFL